ncbi:glycosyltransferase family 10 domain-containing protein [Fortiea contorta]|uniref:glycosyltransferase family 10 domain-containing protein n=1 Tax=Fortiea contorta TaxID=1892405 RepID=UPI000347EF7C|nr:glycosyltransferase family 10 [Fortiea contorta]
MLKIHLLGAPKPTNWSDPRIEFDPAIPLKDSDGLLAWGTITREFLCYRGSRAWYLDEPLSHSMFRTPLFKTALRNLGEHEFLHHSNPNPKFRLPSPTHYGEATLSAPCERKNSAIAVVTNFGGRLWWFRSGARLRNAFILHPNVELFGDINSWKNFRRWPWSKPCQPSNYCGQIKSDWRFSEQVNLLAHYQRVVCFENSSLPYYFTEKFVNAVRAGCVPIYHAHTTVKNTILPGARWIDPADFNFDVSATLAAAEKCDVEKFRKQNYQWLQKEQVKATNGYRIWSRIADLFVEQILGKVT